jgi:hypothetical protein
VNSPLALPGFNFAPRGDADSDDQHTPPWLIDQVTDFWGGIDTDPCWSPEAYVAAALNYHGKTPEQDGLAQPWVGKVWANVPYSNPTPWADRCAAHAGAGHGHEVLLLVNVSTTVAWWRRWRPQGMTPRQWAQHRDSCILAGKPCHAARVAFFDKRISFFKNGIERKGNDREQMLVYWGERGRDFAKRFGRFAWVP